MKTRLRLTLAFLFLPQLCFGVNEYYSPARTVRALGMGGAFYALSNDEGAMFYNPSGVSLYGGGERFMLFSTTGQASTSALSGFGKLSNEAHSSQNLRKAVASMDGYENNPFFLGGNAMPYFLTKGMALGLMLADLKANYALLGTGADLNYEATAISDSGLFITRAKQVGKSGVHLGATAKFLYRVVGRQAYGPTDVVNDTSYSLTNFPSSTSGLGADVDLGLTYVDDKPVIGQTLGFGLSLNNVVGAGFPIHASSANAPPALPRMVSVGSFLQFLGPWPLRDSIVRVDFSEVGLGGLSDADFGARTGSPWKHVNLGFETPVASWLVLRGGLHQGNWTAGAGFDLSLVRIEFATYAEELGTRVGAITDRRYALQLSFGVEMRKKEFRVFGALTPGFGDRKS